MAISRIYDIARQSLSVYQSALTVTSHNVSNANNPAFSRQRVLLASEPPAKVNSFTMGAGVKIADIVRVRDQMIDTQLRKFSQSQSMFDKQNQIYSKLEVLLSEPSDLGLSSLITSFFNSWGELSTNPTSVQLRNNIVNSGRQLTNRFNELYQGYNKIKTELKNEAVQITKEINFYVEQINTLNRQIFEAQSRGVTSNDLMDQRDNVITELSKLVNLTVYQDENGSANVSIGGLLAVDQYHNIDFQVVEDNGKLFLKDGSGNTTLSINEGELGAILKSHSQDIPSFLSSLDSIAQSIVSNVNEIHKTGYTYTNPPHRGLNFFSEYEKGAFAIDAGILNDVRMIAASGDGTDGSNAIAMSIAGLKDHKTISGLTYLEKYSSFISDMASYKNMLEKSSESYKLVLDELEYQKASYSSVSIDEEMMDILKYQKSYDASAKLIKIADQLIETLLSIV